ncbi:MAG: hypothetical protein ACON5H_09190 [Akkermansiaceae bacterium]
MRTLLFIPFFILGSCAPVPPDPTPPPVVAPTHTAPPVVKTAPEVTLRNFTAKDIVLGIKDPETGKPTMYSIPARSKRRIEIAAGTYSWAATAEKAGVKKGQKNFASGQTYLWDFNLD